MRSKLGNQRVEDIAASLYLQVPNLGVDQLRRELEAMIDAGSRYRNIDHELGSGASLVLGTSLPETM